ncbi:hypothetical protein [Nonomuraea dietziae]|uniref:hypothetical protein n=1 Tax=Nonomuraea dietziae TaxID=65515 RepID=UPI0031D3B33E
MSGVMLAGDKLGLMRDQPPKRIVRALLPGHPRAPKQGEKPLAVLMHYAFGAGAGALLALVTRGARRVLAGRSRVRPGDLAGQLRGLGPRGGGHAARPP